MDFASFIILALIGSVSFVHWFMFAVSHIRDKKGVATIWDVIELITSVALAAVVAANLTAGLGLTIVFVGLIHGFFMTVWDLGQKFWAWVFPKKG